MIKKFSALCIAAAVSFGSFAMATPEAQSSPSINECLQQCAPFLNLPNGGVCVLTGCLEVEGGVVLCGYSCFYPLPDPPVF